MVITNPRQLLPAPVGVRPPSRQPSFLRLLLAPSIFAVLALCVAGASWFVLRPEPFITAQLQNTTVRAGDYLTITVVYRNAKNLGVDENAVAVTDVSGRAVTVFDLMDRPMFTDALEASQQKTLSDATVRQRRLWGDAMLHDLGQLSGFSVAGEYDSASAYASSLSAGLALPYVSKLIACPSVTPATLPTTTTKDYRLMVLPKTPPGQYTITIPKIFFCGSSAPSLAYTITVEAAGS